MITGGLVETETEGEAEGDVVTLVLVGLGLVLAGGVVGAVVVGAVVGSSGSVVGSSSGGVGIVGGAVVRAGRVGVGRPVGSWPGGVGLLDDVGGFGVAWVVSAAPAYCGWAGPITLGGENDCVVEPFSLVTALVLADGLLTARKSAWSSFDWAWRKVTVAAENSIARTAAADAAAIRLRFCADDGLLA